jgi:hypothetical protein
VWLGMECELVIGGGWARWGFIAGGASWAPRRWKVPEGAEGACDCEAVARQVRPPEEERDGG